MRLIIETPNVAREHDHLKECTMADVLQRIPYTSHNSVELVIIPIEAILFLFLNRVFDSLSEEGSSSAHTSSVESNG